MLVERIGFEIRQMLIRKGACPYLQAVDSGSVAHMIVEKRTRMNFGMRSGRCVMAALMFGLFIG